LQKTKIDWPGLDYTWNPVIGCKRNCFYCYAKRMNTRFKWIPDWNKPQYFPNRLEIPLKVERPSTWFVGSISDICYWYTIWILNVLAICKICNQHKFMFLTKQPDIYNHLTFPLNCMLGLTINSDADYKKYADFLNIHERGNKTFLSIEPLLGTVNLSLSETCIDLVIVGADSTKGAKPPKKEWIESIKHPNIHWKANIKKYLSLGVS